MKKPLKWSIIGLIVLVLVGYSAYSWMKPLPVELIQVQPQTLTDSLVEEGTIVADKEVQISSQIGGRIEQMAVHVGDRVNKGSLLFTLNTKDLQFQLADLEGQLASISGQAASAYLPPYSAQLKQQELSIDQANLQVETADKELERSLALFEANAISKEEYEQVLQNDLDKKNRLAQQEEALRLLKEQSRTPSGLKEQFAGSKQSIQARIDQLNDQLMNGKVYAPMSGIIKQIDYKEGASLAPLANVLTLIQTERWYVEVSILQEDFQDIKEGMNVTITQKRKNKDVIISGKVSQISSIAVETVSPLGITERKIKLRVQPTQLSNSLIIGSTVDVSFPIHTEAKKLVLPKTSLFSYNKGDAVWIVRDGKAHVQVVKKGYETAEDVAIEEGLKPGDSVIRDPQTQGLKEGIQVERLADR
ncbi:efflux RND transporter periplasmic adaptor subunit [Brevibacillus ginsengisoli]|uniref:efflux RND transporter periplasmic adaptor subunit n=1 Tax=Brevibacillus ginsengisoli TaxID=363854 RepID=UPI003CF39634